MKDILTITNLYMGVLFMVIMLLLFIITLIVSVRKKIKYDINYKEYTKNSGITLEECESLLDEFITREFDNSGPQKGLPQIALMDTDCFGQRIKTDDTDFTNY